MDSPNLTFPGAYNILNDVSVTAADDVWAVGGRQPGILLHWNGSTWTLVNGAAQFTRSVDAAGPTQVWAVGTVQYNTSEGGPVGPYPIGFQLAGAAWQSHESTRELAYFNAVTARAAADIIGVGSSGATTHSAVTWAVGEFYNTTGTTQTLTERYTC